MSGRFRVVGTAVLGLALAVAALPARPAAQQSASTPSPQTPTFKVEVNFVEVDVLVTDQQGRFVRGLTRDDFQVFEDGKPQTINTFSVVDIPVEQAVRPLFAGREIEPDVQTNEHPFDGRVYVMVLDDLHTHPLRVARVKAAARQFIEHRLGVNDLMAVVHTGGPGKSQDFTNNKRLLLDAVDKLSGLKLTSATINRTNDWRVRGFDTGPQGGAFDPDDQQRVYQAQSALGTLKSIADWFAGVHGRRKAILFVSEGIDYDIYNVFSDAGGAGGPTQNNLGRSNAAAIVDGMRELVTAATRSDVAIYGIDPRGLTSLGDEEIEVQDYPDDPSAGVGHSSLMNELRLSQDSLRAISDETGGFAVVNQNDFGSAYERVVRDNSSYYVIAYYPPNDKRDGRYHKIDVRVNRPGLTVRARKGYVAPKGKATVSPGAAPAGTSAELRDALNSPLPVSGLTLHAFVAPFRGSDQKASVLVGAELRGRDLQLGASDTVELSFMAVDLDGKIRGGGTGKLTVSPSADTKARIQQTGLRLLNRTDLPPGRYQVRIGARDGGGGSVGSVTCDLDVPDYTKTTFAMSGLVLTSKSASALPTARADEQLRTVLPGPPVGLREFPQNDEITLFVEVYDNQASTPHKVDITTTVTADDGRVLFKNEDTRDSSEIQGKRGGYGHVAHVPLAAIPPGLVRPER